MKEIIYLDTELLNSLLAQSQQGLITGFSLEQNSQETETEAQQSASGKSLNLIGELSGGSGFFPGLNGKLRGGIGTKGDELTSESRSFLEGQKDILNKAFHDYALEILLTDLDEKGKLLNFTNTSQGNLLEEGDFYLEENTYQFYDFELIDKLLNVEKMQNIFMINFDEQEIKRARKILNKPNPSTREREEIPELEALLSQYDSLQSTANIIKSLNSISSYFSNTMSGQSFIKAGNKIGVLNNSYLKSSPLSLSLRPDNGRKAKILMRVIGQKNNVYSDNNMPNFREEDLDKIPNMLFDIFLGSFNMIKKGDFLVTPIAIYYE